MGDGDSFVDDGVALHCISAATAAWAAMPCMDTEEVDVGQGS